MEIEVVKHLSFEDVSLTLPENMRLQAMQTDEPLTAADLKRVLDELAERSEVFRRLEKDAVERASGCGPAELAYLRDDIERLKGTAVELCAEAAFMEALKENRALPANTYVDDSKKNDGKKHREQVEALKQEIEQTIQKLVRSLQEFDAGVSASRAQLRGVEEAHAFVAEQTAAGPSSLEAVLRESAAERAALAAAEAADRELRAQLAARLRENAAAAHELAPAEARIAEMLEEARALEAKQAGERKAHDTQKRVEEAALYSSELCALLRGLSAVELLRATPGGLLLRVSAAGGEHELDLAVDGSVVTGIAFQAADPRLSGLVVADLEGMHVSVAVDEVRVRIAQAAAEWSGEERQVLQSIG